VFAAICPQTPPGPTIACNFPCKTVKLPKIVGLLVCQYVSSGAGDNTRDGRGRTLFATFIAELSPTAQFYKTPARKWSISATFIAKSNFGRARKIAKDCGVCCH